MNKKIPKFKIPKPEKEVKGWQDLNEFYRQARDPEAPGTNKPAPFFRVKKSIVKKDMPGLNPTQRLIGIAIYAHYNPKKGYSWPSWKDMQEFCGVTENTIQRNLPIVLKHLNIRKEKVSGSNNRYFVS